MRSPRPQPTPIDAIVEALDLSRVRHHLTRTSAASISERHWPSAELEYRRFLTLKRRHPGELLVPPSTSLQIWQAHILDTRAYRRDTDRILGRYLDHFPYLGASDARERVELAHATARFSELFEQYFSCPCCSPDSESPRD